MSPSGEVPGPKRLIRFCGADCANCSMFERFLRGDPAALVNDETGYRCCWLPNDYPTGRDCPIRVCCEGKGVLFCGSCGEFGECARMREFYSQPGYEELRRRMLDQVNEGCKRHSTPPA